MLVVSDTSPLRGLSAIELLRLIPDLYGEAFVPPAVEAELAVPVIDLPVLTIDAHPYLLRRAPKDVARVRELERQLDRGEAEAIALAVELGADALLIDELRGRRAALAAGIRPIGLLGVLMEAKAQGLIPALAPLIERLRTRIAFRIDGAVLADVLRQAGEG